MLEILKNPNFDFLGKTKIFVGLSLALILGGFAFMLGTGVYLGEGAKGYGVEFSGGTQLILHFEKTPETSHPRRRSRRHHPDLRRPGQEPGPGAAGRGRREQPG